MLDDEACLQSPKWYFLFWTWFYSKVAHMSERTALSGKYKKGLTFLPEHWRSWEFRCHKSVNPRSGKDSPAWAGPAVTYLCRPLLLWTPKDIVYRALAGSTAWQHLDTSPGAEDSPDPVDGLLCMWTLDRFCVRGTFHVWGIQVSSMVYFVSV